MRKAFLFLFIAVLVGGCEPTYTKLKRYIRPDWTTVGGALWNNPVPFGTDVVVYTVDECTQDKKKCTELATGTLGSETAVEQILAAFAQSVPMMYGLEHIPSDTFNITNSAASRAGAEAANIMEFNHLVHMGRLPFD